MKNLIISFLLISALASGYSGSGSGEVKEIVILESGFFSKDTIKIRYDSESYKILEVLENGVKVDPEEYYRYQDLVNEAQEFKTLENLKPKLDSIEAILNRPDFPEEVKLLTLQEAQEALKKLKSKMARTQFEMMNARRGILGIEMFIKKVTLDARLAKMDLGGPVTRIMFEEDKFIVNDVTYPDSLNRKYRKLYKLFTGQEIEEGTNVYIEE